MGYFMGTKPYCPETSGRYTTHSISHSGRYMTHSTAPFASTFTGPTKLKTAFATFEPYPGNNSSNTPSPCRRLLRAYRSDNWCPLVDEFFANHNFRLLVGMLT